MPTARCKPINGKWCNADDIPLKEGDIIKCGNKWFTIQKGNVVYFNSSKHESVARYKAHSSALATLETEANSNQQGIFSSFLNYVSYSFSIGDSKQKAKKQLNFNSSDPGSAATAANNSSNNRSANLSEVATQAQGGTPQLQEVTNTPQISPNLITPSQPPVPDAEFAKFEIKSKQIIINLVRRYWTDKIFMPQDPTVNDILMIVNSRIQEEWYRLSSKYDLSDKPFMIVDTSMLHRAYNCTIANTTFPQSTNTLQIPAAASLGQLFPVQ